MHKHNNNNLYVLLVNRSHKRSPVENDDMTIIQITTKI